MILKLYKDASSSKNNPLKSEALLAGAYKNALREEKIAKEKITKLKNANEWPKKL